MRADTTIGLQKPHAAMIRRMAVIEGVSVTDMIGLMIETKLTTYPAPHLAIVRKGLASE
jgi:hypothetical protein